MTIQFLGYEQKPTGRVYGFRVIDNLRRERMFELSIKNHLISDNKFKIQDIPDLCFARLKGALTSETELDLLPSELSVTDAELKRYIEVHYPAKAKRDAATHPHS